MMSGIGPKVVDLQLHLGGPVLVNCERALEIEEQFGIQQLYGVYNVPFRNRNRCGYLGS